MRSLKEAKAARELAYMLTMAGVPDEEIARRVGYSCAKVVQQAVKQHCHETGAEMPLRAVRETYQVTTGAGRTPMLVIGAAAIATTTWVHRQRLTWSIQKEAIFLRPRSHSAPSAVDDAPPRRRWGGSVKMDEYVFKLYVVAQLPLQEIAERIGKSVPTVHRYIRRHAARNGLPAPERLTMHSDTGYVTVRKEDSRLCVALESPLATLGWQPGDVVRWENLSPVALRLERTS